MSKHTPPLFILASNPPGLEYSHCITTQGGAIIADVSRSYAFFIVRAVNAHVDLVAALREIADGCAAYRPGHVNEHKNRTKAMIEEIARAALAKAEGEAP